MTVIGATQMVAAHPSPISNTNSNVGGSENRRFPLVVSKKRYIGYIPLVGNILLIYGEYIWLLYG